MFIGKKKVLQTAYYCPHCKAALMIELNMGQLKLMYLVCELKTDVYKISS